MRAWLVEYWKANELAMMKWGVPNSERRCGPLFRPLLILPHTPPYKRCSCFAHPQSRFNMDGSPVPPRASAKSSKSKTRRPRVKKPKSDEAASAVAVTLEDEDSGNLSAHLYVLGRLLSPRFDLLTPLFD